MIGPLWGLEFMSSFQLWALGMVLCLLLGDYNDYHAVCRRRSRKLRAICLPLVRVFYPALIAQDLVGVEPLARRDNKIFSFRPVYVRPNSDFTVVHQAAPEQSHVR